MSIPDLLHISQVKDYIATLTGVKVSQRAVRRWLNTGEILTIVLPNDRRRKWTRQKYVDDFIYARTTSEPEVTVEEIMGIKPIKRSKHKKRRK